VIEDDISKAQQSICARFSCDPVPAPLHLKVGIARNIREGALPINGMRIIPEGDTTGWYLWGGDQFSEDPDFFLPVHVEHLKDWCPTALPYLQLPPGWRFLIAPGHEDVWFDKALLEQAHD
jgi:hypothetical protein